MRLLKVHARPPIPLRFSIPANNDSVFSPPLLYEKLPLRIRDDDEVF